MQRVVMYCTPTCRFCLMAEKLLQKKGVARIEKIFVSPEQSLRTEMIEKTGRRTVPQIFIGETHVGGYDELSELEKKGELEELLGPR